jgi:hypothetical protein
VEPPALVPLGKRRQVVRGLEAEGLGQSNDHDPILLQVPRRFPYIIT